MKQVTYDLDIKSTLSLLVSQMEGIEDGYWELTLQTENLTATIPRVFNEQSMEALPGHIIRLKGFRLVRHPNWPSIAGTQAVCVRDGKVVTNAIDTDND